MPAAKKATKQAVKKAVAGGTRRARKPTRRQVERAALNILDTSHTTLFGRYYDLSQAESKEACVEFLADMYEQINARVR